MALVDWHIFQLLNLRHEKVILLLLKSTSLFVQGNVRIGPNETKNSSLARPARFPKQKADRALQASLLFLFTSSNQNCHDTDFTVPSPTVAKYDSE